MNKGSGHGRALRTEEDVFLDRCLVSIGYTIAAVARWRGLSKTTVRAAVRGRSWPHVPSVGVERGSP